MTESKARQVQKLLALAERAGTPEESDAAYARAQALMTKWAIDDAMLEAVNGVARDEEITTELIRIGQGPYFRGSAILLMEIANANGAKTLSRKPNQWGKESGARLIGYPSDLVRIQVMYVSMLSHAKSVALKALPDYLSDATNNEQVKWRSHFREAFAVRIGQRLNEQADKTRSESASNDNRLLPVLIDREAKVSAYAASLAGKAVQTRSRRVYVSAWESGTTAADQADIGNTRIGNNRKAVQR